MSPFPQFPWARWPCRIPLGPKLRLRAILTLAMEGAALPSLNSVQASSQRRQPTHFVGSETTRPFARSMMSTGFAATDVRPGPRADIPTIEIPLTQRN